MMLTFSGMDSHKSPICRHDGRRAAIYFGFPVGAVTHDHDKVTFRFQVDFDIYFVASPFRNFHGTDSAAQSSVRGICLRLFQVNG